jgi:hypothetical protein
MPILFLLVVMPIFPAIWIECNECNDALAIHSLLMISCYSQTELRKLVPTELDIRMVTPIE